MTRFDAYLPVNGSMFAELEPGEVPLRAPTVPDGSTFYIGLDDDERLKTGRKELFIISVVGRGMNTVITGKRDDGKPFQFGRPTQFDTADKPDVVPAFSSPTKEIVYIATPEGWMYADSGLITPDGYSIVAQAATAVGGYAVKKQVAATNQLQPWAI